MWPQHVVRYSSTFSDPIGPLLSSSIFCLHMFTDNDSSHRFYDALSANCIPLWIADHHYPDFIPAASYINYENVTVKIPEKAFIDNPAVLIAKIDWVLSNEDVLQRHFYGMMEA